jgi:hypothetical protein
MRPAPPRLLLPFALVLALPALATEQAGVSAAVRGQVALNRLQVAIGRQVVGGEPILLQDAIKSGQRSGMQILLLDETVFTIGPESELVIDEFVYDPRTNAGKLSAEITKGVFRFVSGKIAHEKPEDMNVKLPSGTLGVRGTMVAGRVDPTSKGSRLVLLGEGPENDTGSPAGAFLACNAGKCVRINRPGFGTIIEGPDSPPVTPFLFSREEIDALTRAVSDPQSWVETATSGASETPDVAAGPADEGGVQGDDPRSATEVSGISKAGGTGNSDTTRSRLRTLEGLDQASTDVSQFSNQTVSVNGREVALPENCSDVSSCLGGVSNPFPTLPTDINITTVDQLSALAGRGLVGQYQQPGLGLITYNNGQPGGQPDGSYDFSLQVDFDNQRADLNFNNVNSRLLGLSDVSFGQTTNYSEYPTGVNYPAVFVATGEVTGSIDGPCGASCSAVGEAYLSNANNGRIADSAQQLLLIAAPDSGNGIVTGTVSADPYVPIPRP